MSLKVGQKSGSFGWWGLLRGGGVDARPQLLVQNYHFLLLLDPEAPKSCKTTKKNFLSRVFCPNLSLSLTSPLVPFNKFHKCTHFATNGKEGDKKQERYRDKEHENLPI